MVHFCNNIYVLAPFGKKYSIINVYLWHMYSSNKMQQKSGDDVQWLDKGHSIHNHVYSKPDENSLIVCNIFIRTEEVGGIRKIFQ